MRSRRQMACGAALVSKWCVPLVLSLGLYTGVSASERPLSLAEAATRALASGPDARIASLETGQAEDALAEARSAYLPRASISSQAGYSNRLDERLRTVDRNGRERTYGLSSLGSDQGWFNFYIDQLLFDLGTWRGMERAALSAEAGRISEAEKREAITLDVLRHYVEVLRFDEIVALDDRRIAVAGRLDAHAASLLAAGRIVTSEREEAALAFETLRMHAAERAGTRTAARRALANATGAEPDETWTLVPESLPSAAPVVADTNAWNAEAELATAPEVQLLNLRKRMEEVNVAAARAGRYPTVGLRAGYSNYGAQRYDNFPDELSVGVDLTVPLFDGFKARNAIAGALKGAEIARVRYASMLERKRARVQELARELDMGMRKPPLAARQAAVAEERLRLAEVRLQSDRGTLSDVMTASEASGRDARAAVNARFDVVVVWATLQRELGRLSAAIVGPSEGEAQAPAERSAEVAPEHAERQ